MSERDLPLRARRRLAFDLLKRSRNPAYVAMRYGFDVEKLEKALAKIPEPKTEADYKRSPAAARVRETFQRAGELLPQTKFGARVLARAEREPGEDDDLGETEENL